MEPERPALAPAPTATPAAGAAHYVLLPRTLGHIALLDRLSCCRKWQFTLICVAIVLHEVLGKSPNAGRAVTHAPQTANTLTLLCQRLRLRLSPQFWSADDAGPSTSAAEPEVPTFLAFAGSGRRLDGRAAAPAAPVPVRLGTYEVRHALRQGLLRGRWLHTNVGDATTGSMSPSAHNVPPASLILWPPRLRLPLLTIVCTCDADPLRLPRRPRRGRSFTAFVWHNPSASNLIWVGFGTCLVSWQQARAGVAVSCRPTHAAAS